MSKKSIILFVITALLFFSCNKFPVEFLQLYPTSLTMLVGERNTLDAWIEPIEANTYNRIRWISSDNKVAQVDGNGVVTAVYSGICIITAIAGDIRRECVVTVKPLTYNLGFSTALAYYFGDNGALGFDRFILKLFSDGYRVETDGSVSGAGYYFNIELFSPNNGTEPAVATYTANVQPQTFTYIPGKIIERTDGTYASGTFFHYSSLGGSMAIMIENGGFSIRGNTGNYTLTGTLTGDRAETLQISYSGALQIVDLTLPPPDTLHFNCNNLTVTNLGNIYGYGQNIFRATFASPFGVALQVEFIAPLSASSIPNGFYRLDGTNNVFSLVSSNAVGHEGTILTENSQTLSFLFGNVTVSTAQQQTKYTAYLVDENKRVVVLEYSHN
ncbi:MAG: Ig-like domain-containing protein [Prevotellaceae bacterium]|nr:Ig-like domain-containing protein [Prevotellaceae bacterium]